MEQEKENGERDVNTPSPFEAKTRERLDGLAIRFEDHQAAVIVSNEKIWEVIEKVRDRPPTWVSWVMTAGGTAIGAMIMNLIG